MFMAESVLDVASTGGMFAPALNAFTYAFKQMALKVCRSDRHLCISDRDLRACVVRYKENKRVP